MIIWVVSAWWNACIVMGVVREFKLGYDSKQACPIVVELL